MKPILTYHKNWQLLCKAWVVHGKFHRVDGPAIQSWDKDNQLRLEEWWIEGKRHRLDGAAFQSWDKNGQLWCEEWWIEGNKVKPISDPLEWALFIAKNFGNVQGLKKFCLDNIDKKKAILAFARIL